jgi:hypothetical protein
VNTCMRSAPPFSSVVKALLASRIEGAGPLETSGERFSFRFPVFTTDRALRSSGDPAPAAVSLWRLQVRYDSVIVANLGKSQSPSSRRLLAAATRLLHSTLSTPQRATNPIDGLDFPPLSSPSTMPSSS